MGWVLGQMPQLGQEGRATPRAKASRILASGSEFGMVLPDPRGYTLAQIERQTEHLFDFELRYGFSPLVVRNVALLPEQVELLNLVPFQANREFDGLDDPVMVICALSLVATGGEGGCGELQGGVVGDVELPIGD